MSSKNFIELNGKRYDVLTGKVLSDQAAKHKAGRALDGVSKPSSDAVRHKTERSRTLMRHAVKKPAPPTKTASAPSVQRHSAPHLDIDPKRVSRAQKIHKSHLVSRFGHAPGGLKPQTSVLAVQPEPTLSEHHPIPLEKTKPGRFQEAIDKATSHTEPHHRPAGRRQRLARKMRVSSRVVNITAASLAVLLLAGFITYQNVPNLSMRIAATRAGVQGDLPGYEPAGFGLSGPIHYKRGQITFSYKSSSDQRKFQISQRNSGWDSATLLENYVAVNRRPYQTYQDSGKTIYIYEGDNATWVDGGIWYRIEGNSSLNNDQLLRLAASM
jgi:hypothetical protein